MQHPLPVGTRCRLSRSHMEILRREGRILSEAEQTLTILRSGIVGEDIRLGDDEGWYREGGVGYVAQFLNSESPCSFGHEELDDHYEVVSSGISTDVHSPGSKEAMKAYCHPTTCFNTSCQGGNPADKRCARCRWATYCSQECQKIHWKAHKRECANLVESNNFMFGRESYKKNKDHYKPPAIRYDVVGAKMLNLSLCTTIMGKKAIRDISCNPDIFRTVTAFLENGKGCSVDVERQADGTDVVTAAYNVKAEE